MGRTSYIAPMSQKQAHRLLASACAKESRDEQLFESMLRHAQARNWGVMGRAGDAPSKLDYSNDAPELTGECQCTLLSQLPAWLMFTQACRCGSSTKHCPMMSTAMSSSRDGQVPPNHCVCGGEGTGWEGTLCIDI